MTKITLKYLWQFLLKRSPCGENIEPVSCTCNSGSSFDWPTAEERCSMTIIFCTCNSGSSFDWPTLEERYSMTIIFSTCISINKSLIGLHRKKGAV